MPAMHSVHLDYSNRVKSLVWVLGLNEALDQLIVTNICNFMSILRREDGHVMRSVLLEFLFEATMVKGRLKIVYKRLVDENKCMNIELFIEDC